MCTNYKRCSHRIHAILSIKGRLLPAALKPAGLWTPGVVFLVEEVLKVIPLTSLDNERGFKVSSAL